MGQKLHNRIESWKKLLLDFGKRNRLINFKESKRSNVHIISPSYNLLYEKIAINEESLAFPFSKKVLIDDEGDEFFDSVIKGDLETDKTISELQKTLKALRYKANTSIEEQGINILFLTFGMMKWRERDDSNEVFSSPMVLVPVKLTIESLTSPYVLSPHEDEIVVNPTLRHKLENDFGILLPEFDGTQDSLSDYLTKCEKVIENKGWTIEKSVHLTNLSFLKINMYKDLERNEERLSANPIIAAIAGENDSLDIPEDINDYDHDNNEKPIDVFQVVDADASQQDAILLSKKGASFVLQGPPGTGKSQTITNIISEALADGKKVLFVSEKMAALQVVYNRLSSVGLADFCFTLHSHKANKKEILRELANSISIDRKKVRDEALAQLDLLEKKRETLNKYQEELHTPCSALNISIFEANGRLAKLNAVPDVIFPIQDVEKIDIHALNSRKYLLNELSKTIGKRSRDYDKNVWKGANVEFLSYELRHDIDSNVTNLIPLLHLLDDKINACCEYLGIQIPRSIVGADNLLKILDVFKESPIIPYEWVLDSKFKGLKDEVYIHKQLHEDYTTQENVVLEQFEGGILELDYSPILQRFERDYQTVFRLFKSQYRRDLKQLRSFSKDNEKLSFRKALNTLIQLKAVAESKEKINQVVIKCQDNYGSNYKGNKTDWDGLINSVCFADNLKTCMVSNTLHRSIIETICSNSTCIDYCREQYDELQHLINKIKEPFEWFTSLFEDKEKFNNTNLIVLSGNLAQCKDNKQLLEEWIDYHSNIKKCAESGLSDYVDQIDKSPIDDNYIVGAYLKRFYRLWLDQMLLQFPSVRDFRSRIQEQNIREFCALDKEQFKIAQARIRERLVSRIPDFNAITSSRDEIGILKRELNKQRRIMPLRKLFMAIPNLLSAIRPCFMMSPLSVSVFLEARSYEFDLVVFDEASQVHTEDAIGAIMRGKQVIIVGDTKQLPPTSFFAAALNDEEFDVDDEDIRDAGAYESILDEAVAILPERSLRWHYRSRDEHLIAFSNLKIYNGSLITFPSSVEKAPDLGVEYIHVADGVYDRGGKKNNMVEAKRVAQLVFDHFKKYPQRSLGVVTFSEAQQNAVDAAIRQMRLNNSAYEKYFSDSVEEPFFIKNLENVQGDERDTIIFSIGYAKDNRGIMYMNFGPLSRDGGFRRLNVAITRAKYNVKLVGSIQATDIDLDKASSEGVKLLRSYIEYAQQGITALEKELNYNYDLNFDSPFEEAVFDFLTSKGYEVVTQVGCSGFRIDMAIKHPSQNGKFAIGIECDGATYHSSRTARERDRLRQTVLEDMGWTIYRIWSTDWIKNPKSEEKKLINAIEAALSGLDVVSSVDSLCLFDQLDNSENRNIEIEELVESNKENSHGYDFDVYESINYLDFWNGDVSETIRKIIEKQQPIHFEALCRILAPIWGNQKATSVIRREVEYYFHWHLKDIVNRKGDFVSLVGFNDLKVRISKDSNDIRPIEYISDEELALALSTIAQHSFGITPNDLITETARVYGFKRTGERISSTLRRVYNNLVENGKIKEIDGKVNVT
jgi:very-short-patch-repair endonuclease